MRFFKKIEKYFAKILPILLSKKILYAWKKSDQTDSCAPKCIPRVTKTVMYIVITYRDCDIFTVAGVETPFESDHRVVLILIANNEFIILRFVLDSLAKLVAVGVLQSVFGENIMT
jgi:hypothetical protein